LLKTFKKIFFCKNKEMVSKNAEFHADFRSVKKVLKNAHKKSKTSLRNLKGGGERGVKET
jgi:hypothetical protein